MTTATDDKHVLIGTAGHIDHGKTRLVANLTGIDTDRLPEEKTRGISIDLGFAHWKADGFQFGVVDVPGHERFVKNMVAGATGVNLALLVVAADDGVMPQTREHLDIMQLLGLTTGAVAITKIDLVEPDFVELVKAEVEDLVAGTFLEGGPVLTVSSETGEGVDALRRTLSRLAAEAGWADTDVMFRLPIDRVFSIPGHGTVVTGSVQSGQVRSGDVLELLPDEREVRVRSVENYGLEVEDSGARQRTAVNLAGVKTDELGRGKELATPGFLKPTGRIVVRLKSLSTSSLVLKDRIELNLHLGTAEVPVRVILKGRRLKPGETAYAELRSQSPMVAAHGQRFILRRNAPSLTVAGGVVLDPFVPPHKRIKDLDGHAESLDTQSDRQRLSFWLSGLDRVPDNPLEAAWRTGIRSAEYSARVEELCKDGELIRLNPSLLVHRRRLEALSGSMMRTVRAELAKHQPRRTLRKNTLLTACREIAGPQLLEAVFAHLEQTGQLIGRGANLGPADAQVALTKNQRQTYNRLLERIAESGLTPPTIKELAAEQNRPIDQIELLLNLSVEDGELVKLSNNLYFTPESLDQARQRCRDLLNEAGEATLSQIREALGVSRKFAVPLCEYFDATGVTTRDGDVRRPGPKMESEITAG